MRSTYSLDMILKDLCRDDNEAEVVERVLRGALYSCQWLYQNGSTRQFRDVNQSNERCVVTVLDLLRGQGQDSVADELEYVFYDHIDKDTQTKSKTLSKAKQMMKHGTLELSSTITQRRYNEDFAELMKEAFIEQCEEYPLDTAPEGTDIHFEPDWY